MTFYYLVTVYFLRILFRIIYGFTVKGRNNWDRSSSLIIASNHRSLLDPLFVGSAAPIEICYLAKQEIFSWPVLGFLARTFNAFPTKRSGFDLEAFRTAGRILGTHKPLLVFIEGTRSRDGEMLPAKKGVGLIAYQNQADVMPVYVHGSLKLWRAFLRNPRITVQFGKIIPFSRYQNLKLPRKELYTHITDDIMASIKDLGAQYHHVHTENVIDQ